MNAKEAALYKGQDKCPCRYDPEIYDLCDEPATHTCDVCGSHVCEDHIFHSFCYGIETYFCAMCRDEKAREFDDYIKNAQPLGGQIG